jgi:apolipoprotein N-acyltransferase
MQTKEQTIEAVVIKIEAYVKTNLELVKLQAVEKTADITSKLISRTFFFIAFSFFALFINIGLSFWLGEILGKDYYGFAIVAGFYLLLSFVLMFLHRSIICTIKNHLINQILN